MNMPRPSRPGVRRKAGRGQCGRWCTLIRGLSCAYDFEGCRFHRQRVRRAERDEFLWPLPAVASIGDLSLEEQADILVFLQTHDLECAGNDTREEILAELRAAPSARGAAPVAPSPRRAGL